MNLLSGVIWITGVSGSGKTTLAKQVISQLKVETSPVYLDGDDLREIFFDDSKERIDKYDRQSRLSLAKKYARLANHIASQGFTVIIATISLFHEIHTWNRSNIKNYFEVFINVPLDILLKRDPKGIYQSYYNGKIKNIAGLDLKVEKPKAADFIVNYSPDNSILIEAQNLIKSYKEKGMK